MAKGDKDNELRFTAAGPVDWHDRRARSVLSQLSRLGIKPAFDIPLREFETYEDLAGQTPTTSPRSYLGQEHFRVHADRHGLKQRVATTVFRRLVYPWHTNRGWGSQLSPRAAEANAAITAFYGEIDIVTHERGAVGMPLIPAHLQRQQHGAIDNMATPASSLLAAADNIDGFRALAAGVGEDTAEGLLVIAQSVQDHLDSHQQKLF